MDKDNTKIISLYNNGILFVTFSVSEYKYNEVIADIRNIYNKYKQEEIEPNINSVIASNYDYVEEAIQDYIYSSNNVNLIENQIIEMEKLSVDPNFFGI